LLHQTKRNINLILKTMQELTPKQANELLNQVRTNLETLISLGESYAHFQSAQATHKYLKRAKKNLEGLS